MSSVFFRMKQDTSKTRLKGSSDISYQSTFTIDSSCTEKIQKYLAVKNWSECFTVLKNLAREIKLLFTSAIMIFRD